MHTFASLFINIHLCKMYIDTTFFLGLNQYLLVESTQVYVCRIEESLKRFRCLGNSEQ